MRMAHEVFKQENTLYKYCNLFSFTKSFVWFPLQDSRPIIAWYCGCVLHKMSESMDN